MRPIAIVGNFRGGVPVPYDDDIEIWAFNVGAKMHPRIDVLFELHDLELIPDDYLGWLNQQKLVYVTNGHSALMREAKFPYDEALALTEHIHHHGKALRFFKSSVCLALALAIMKKPPRIDVYGVELIQKHEYTTQIPGFTFWVGFAAGRGIPMEIYSADHIFRVPVFGLEYRPEQKWARKGTL
jgi:hypothetical protein